MNVAALSAFFCTTTPIIPRTKVHAGDSRFLPTLKTSDAMAITDVFADYVRYHFDIRAELKTMGFLRSILTV